MFHKQFLGDTADHIQSLFLWIFHCYGINAPDQEKFSQWSMLPAPFAHYQNRTNIVRKRIIPQTIEKTIVTGR